MLYMVPNMSPVQVMLMWQVLDENSRGYICEFSYFIMYVSLRKERTRAIFEYFCKDVLFYGGIFNGFHFWFQSS